MLSTIGARIKERRLSQGMTQEGLGNIVGVNKVTIHKYENGIITNIPSDRLELLAIALKVTPAYLMGWEEVDETAANQNQSPIILAREMKGLSEGQIDLIRAMIEQFKKTEQ